MSEKPSSIPAVLQPRCDPDDPSGPPLQQSGASAGKLAPLRSLFNRLSRATGAHIFLTAVFLMFPCMSIPHIVLINDIESAWSAVLTFARSNSLQFGSDVVFTYGPLGFLTINHFSSYATELTMVVNGLLSFAVTLGVCLLAWRLPKWWRILLIGSFTLVAANVGYGAHDFLINLGVLAWALLTLLAARHRLVICSTVLVALAGFAGLTKFTGLIGATFAVGAVFIELVVRKERHASVGILVSFFLVLGVGWLLTGQKLSNAPDYLAYGFTMSKSYTACMNLTPLPGALVGGLLAAVTALGVAGIKSWNAFEGRQRLLWLQRSALMCWLSSLIFLSWKHAFVRADRLHVLLFLGFIPVFVLLLMAIQTRSRNANRWAQMLAILACISSMGALEWVFTPACLDVSQPLHLGYINARSVFQQSEYRRQMQAALDIQKNSAALPRVQALVGTGTVDVFGNHPCSALWNQINYHPRPVFLSYAAYAEPLMKLNEDFYHSANAPKFVLAELWAIDKRFPPLEDAFALRYLLMNYQRVATEGGFILLKRKSSNAVHLTLLKEGTVRVGQLIDLRQFGEANVWLQLTLDQTLAGRMREFLYQPPGPHLLVWSAEHEKQPMSFNAPAPMLKAGFVASPLLATFEQMDELFRGKPVTRPEAYSIELGRNSKIFWRQTVHYRVYRMENPLGNT